jgi:hypothetical protein
MKTLFRCYMAALALFEAPPLAQLLLHDVIKAEAMTNYAPSTVASGADGRLLLAMLLCILALIRLCVAASRADLSGPMRALVVGVHAIEAPFIGALFVRNTLARESQFLPAVVYRQYVVMAFVIVNPLIIFVGTGATAPAVTGRPSKKAASPAKKQPAAAAAGGVPPAAAADAPQGPAVWRCAACGKVKELSGAHLRGKRELRSECWPCGRKQFFRLEAAKEHSQ